MVVTNTEASLEVVSVISLLGCLVLMAISSTKGTSVTTTSVADVSITLVVPVVGCVIMIVWVLEAIWSPGKVISSIDFSEMLIESLNVTWLVVAMTPDTVM